MMSELVIRVEEELRPADLWRAEKRFREVGMSRNLVSTWEIWEYAFGLHRNATTLYLSLVVTASYTSTVTSVSSAVSLPMDRSR